MNFKKKLILVLVAVFFAISTVDAQTTQTPEVSFDIENLLRVGTTDASKYLEGYLGGTMNALNTGIGSGWYNTAKPHKFPGIDVTATISMASIPKSQRSFIYNSGDYKNLELVDESGKVLPDGTELPTLFFGSTSHKLRIKADASIKDPATGETVNLSQNQEFPALGGILPEEVSKVLPTVAVPVPMIQLGIGLPKSTDLKIRYGSDFGQAKGTTVRMIGFGVLHDIKQWIPGIKGLPFDLAGFIGYSNLSIKYSPEINSNGLSSDNLELKFGASNTTIQGIISKKLLFFTPYVGVGASFGNTYLKAMGDLKYEIAGKNTTIKDPLDLKFTGAATPKINIGARLKILWVLTLHAEYTIQKYNTFTMGLGVSVR